MDGFEGAGRTQFALGALLGAGTFGEVYLARMTSPNGIQQNVAMKLLNPGLHPKSQPISRMRDEGHMLASLNHPAILAVKDLCVIDGRIGLVTEFVPGSDLHDLIFDAEDPIPAKPLLQVVSALADALDVAWKTPAPTGTPMALVHRDVKPVNVRVTPHGSVKLLDFGIATSEDERRETATVERMAIGTPPYMAPEVHTYEVLEALPSRDVFALGATLFEGLAHEMFLEGLEAKAIVRLSNQKARFQEWMSLRLPLLADQDPRLVALVARMLRFEHEGRPTARQVADEAAELAEKLPGSSLRAWCQQHAWPPAATKTGPWSGRKVTDEGFGGPQQPTPTRRPQSNPRASGPTVPEGPRFKTGPGRVGTVMSPQRATGDGAGDGEPQAHEDTDTALGAAWEAARRVPWGKIVAAPLVLATVGLGWTAAARPELLPAWLSEPAADASRLVSGLVSGEVGMFQIRQMLRGEQMIRNVGIDTTPLLASGRQWGALPSEQASDLAEIRLGARAEVVLAREGQIPLGLAEDGTSVLVPPGPVQVRARFVRLGTHGPMLELEAAAGERITLVCNAKAEVCVRR